MTQTTTHNAQQISEQEIKAHRARAKKRSLALGLVLAAFAILFYVTTILKMSANLSAGS